jgi:hypothetical protein
MKDERRKTNNSRPSSFVNIPLQRRLAKPQGALNQAHQRPMLRCQIAMILGRAQEIGIVLLALAKFALMACLTLQIITIGR